MCRILKRSRTPSDLHKGLSSFKLPTQPRRTIGHTPVAEYSCIASDLSLWMNEYVSKIISGAVRHMLRLQTLNLDPLQFLGMYLHSSFSYSHPSFLLIIF